MAPSAAGSASPLRRRRRLAGLAAVVAWVMLSLWLSESGRAAPEEHPARDALFEEVARPFLERHCLDCHQGAQAEAGLDLAAALAAPDQDGASGVWKSVLRRLADGSMPPADIEPRPSLDESLVVATVLAGAREHWERRRALRAPQAVVARLSRSEYVASVRDLLGIELDADRWLPADEVGHGFDHIGDVLSMPPARFERYLAAAEQIAQRVIEDDDPRFPPTRHLAGRRLDGQGRARATGQGIRLSSRGEVLGRFDVRRDGIYRIRVRAYGEQAGGEPTRLGLRAANTDLGAHVVRAVRKEPVWIEAAVRLAAGRVTVGVSFLNDYYNPRASDPRQRDRNLVVLALELHGPIGSIAGQRSENHRRFVIAEPGETVTPADAASQVFGRFLPRAFRRPITDEELQRFVDLVGREMTAGSTYEGGLRAGLTAALCSPSFLFHTERGVWLGPRAGVQAIDELGLASRLSFFLWGSVPDDGLRTAATEGRLRRELPEVLARMRSDPRAEYLVTGFLAQWLQLRRLAAYSPDPKRFPRFDDRLRADLEAEALAFVRDWIREDRPLRALLVSDHVFVNARLAAHYGMAGVEGDALRRVPLTGPLKEQRGGLLGLGAVQALTAYPTRTSPVMRGKWVLEQLLDDPPPPAPPGVGALEDLPGIDARLPVRERLLRHRADPACASCHVRMDAIGLALEPYDAVGRWRMKNEHGRPIDPSGRLGNQRFDGPAQLREILAGGDDFPRAFVRHLLVFALGRGLDSLDDQAVETILDAARAEGYRMSALIEGVVRSRPFQTRRIIVAPPETRDAR